MIFYSPPHGWRGEDDFGSGAFLAPRGDRLHFGDDAICVPGEQWASPVSGVILRRRRPYADDLFWSGCIIATPWRAHVTLFYLEVFDRFLGVEVSIGQIIGVAQDISKKYSRKGKVMTPHIHNEIRVSQDFLQRNQSLRDGHEYVRRTGGSMPGIYVSPKAIASNE